MPAVILHTSVTCDDEQKQKLNIALTEICAKAIGKPESVMLSMIYDDATMLFGGKADRAALVEVRSIGGLNESVNSLISEAVCTLLSEFLQIDSANIYLNFTEFERHNWGWNNAVF